jgi:uncharacterized protein (TIGR00290 family)
MLWTGGKDSALALLDAMRNGYDVCCLATFAPPDAKFLAHPLNVIRVQAESLQMPHYLLEIREPFEQGYECALADLRDKTGVTGAVTGDISEVDGQPNWITARTRAIGMRAYAPLWEHDRAALLRELLDAGFTTLISCVDTRWLDASWAGRILDRETIADLQAIRKRNGLDLCGENGEYHTLVVDGPMFARRIEVGARTRCSLGSLAYVDARAVSLLPKEANPSCGLSG